MTDLDNFQKDCQNLYLAGFPKPSDANFIFQQPLVQKGWLGSADSG